MYTVDKTVLLTFLANNEDEWIVVSKIYSFKLIQLRDKFQWGFNLGSAGLVHSYQFNSKETANDWLARIMGLKGEKG